MNYRSEAREWARKCYGGYMSMCKKYLTKPHPYHRFADVIAKGFTTKQAYEFLHRN